MPNIRMPNGDVVAFPDEMSRSEIQGMIASKFPEVAPKPDKYSTTGAFIQGKAQGLTAGLGDEMFAGLTAPVKYAGGRIAQALGGDNKFAEMSLGEIYEDSRAEIDRENQIAREESPWAFGAGEITGLIGTGVAGGTTKAGATVANTIRHGLLPRATSSLGKTANLGSKALVSGAAGGTSAGIYGAGTAQPGERTQGAKDAAMVGGGVSAVLPLAGPAYRGVKRAVTPTVDDALRDVGRLAQKHKIPISLDQVTNSRAVKAFQKNSQDLIGAGQSGFRDKQMQAFNRALLKTVGVEADRITPEVMDSAFEKVGKEFDNLGKGKNFQLGEEFGERVDQILKDTEIANPHATKTVQKSLDMILGHSKKGIISGKNLGKVRADLNALSRKSKDDGVKEVLLDMENLVVDMLTGGDDLTKAAFSKTKQKYKNLLALEPLAAKAKAGNISPTQLHSRVGRIYGRQFTRGKAGDIGDLARVGNELLAQLGGSDTMGRLSAFIQGGALLNPTTMAPTALGLTGNRVLQSGVNRNQKLVNKALERTVLPAVTGPSSASAVPAGLGAAALSTERSSAKPATAPATRAYTPSKPVELERQTPLYRELKPEAKSSFNKSLQFVFDIEGGFVPDDAGKGPSKFGINQSANPDLDIKNITKADAKRRYKKNYWDAIKADDLEPQMALVAFDAAVNQGPAKAKEFIRKAQGSPRKLLNYRRQHYIRLAQNNPEKYGRYLNGWLNRLDKLEAKLT